MVTDVQLMTVVDRREELITSAVQLLPSKHTRAAYSSRLRLFLNWCESKGNPPFTRSLVEDYLANIRESSPSAINQTIAAVKRLATVSAERGWITANEALSISQVRSVKANQARTGNWLEKETAKHLIDLKMGTTPAFERRDRAVIALLLGCALRRTEAVTLQWRDIKQRGGRVVMVVLGKGNKTREVVVPEWAYQILMEWGDIIAKQDGEVQGFVLRSVNQRGEIGKELSTNAIWLIVRYRAERIGIGPLAPHDLRRTFSQLARRGGATLEQIRDALGHSSISTTEKYLGVDLSHAAADRLGL